MSFAFTHPHFAEVHQGGVDVADAEIVVIGFHGRGGNVSAVYNSIAQATAGSSDVAFLVPEGETKVWFRDQFVPADNPQLLKSLEAVGDLILSLNDAGISTDRIVLAGQSQGAVLVDEYLASTGIDVRAVVSWSGALVGPFHNELMAGQLNPFSLNPLKGLEYDIIPDEYRDADLTGQTIQLAVHEDDAKVPLEMVLASAEYYRSQGAVVEMHVEPGSAHNITNYDIDKLRDTLFYDRDNATFESEATGGRGFVTAVVETHRNDPSDSRIVAKVHNALGYSVSDGEFFVQSTQGEIASLDIAVLDNGNIVFAYVGADNVLKADIHTEGGDFVAGHVLATSVDAGSLAVKAVAGGFEVAYASIHGEAAVSAHDAAGEPVDVALAGTSGSDQIIGTEAGDEIFGYRGHDLIEARGGDDLVRGGNGRDQIFGGDGNDKLIGQGGDDVIDGGAGKDKLVGGKGADTFIVAGGQSTTRIMDFEAGIDTIIIQSDSVDTFDDVNVRQLKNGNELITFDDTRLYVYGDYTDADILFA